MTLFSIAKLVKPVMLGGAMLGLSACAYGSGSYGDSYVNGAGYACDPYAPFDDYYACDNGYGYANIGYSGGWYDNFYYPGYGVYIFDRGGSRHSMQNKHRRHWARQRAEYGSRHRRGNDRSDWDRRGDRRQDLTPAQRAERQKERAERQRNWTPAQRAERQERRTERRERRATDGNRTPGQRTERRERGTDRGDRGRTPRATRPNNNRTESRARPTAPQSRAVQQRPAPAARATPRAVPKARAVSRNSRDKAARNKVNKD